MYDLNQCSSDDQKWYFKTSKVVNVSGIAQCIPTFSDSACIIVMTIAKDTHHDEKAREHESPDIST